MIINATKKEGSTSKSFFPLQFVNADKKYTGTQILYDTLHDSISTSILWI